MSNPIPIGRTSPAPSFGNEKEKYDGDVEHKEFSAIEPANFVDPTSFEGCTEEETKAKCKKMVRKIDFRVLPVLILLFILNILDRSNIGNARIAGMSDELKFNQLDYNNMIVVAFVGYSVVQMIVGFFVSKISPAVFLSGAAVTWGIVSMCCGFVESKASLYALRLLVGISEAPFFPSSLLLLSSLYTREELAPRIAIMYSGNSLSNAFGGLLASGVISGMHDVGGYSGWRWLFIIEGLVTIVVGASCYFILPGLPSQTKWLSEEERRLAIWRSSVDASGAADEETDVSKWQAAKMAFKDWKVLLLVLQQTCIACSQSFTYFMPVIVKSLGYDTNTTLLLTAPPYFFAFICSLAVAFGSARLRHTTLFIVIPMLLATVGNVLCVVLPTSNVAGRYTAMFLLCLGSYCSFNLSFAWVSSIVIRPRTKRSGALFLVNSMGAVTHFYTPYFFISTEAPRYETGAILLAVFSGLVCVTAVVIRFALKHQNRKLDRLDAANEPYTGSLEGIPKGYRFRT